ncbi:MAG: [Bacilli bacterium]|nr:[FeFe] hydrogenase, group A [Bacilli bacterium]
MEKGLLEVPISKNNDAIEKNEKKCIVCGLCMRVCTDDVTVARMYEIDSLKEPICINCGQCSNVCPTDAIREKLDYLKVKNILHNKKGKKVVFSIAPAVRVSLGESLGYSVGTNLEGKIASILRSLGADYVFDITFGADLTIMEEAMEFVNRIKNNGVLPQFTSCCPAWVKYLEIFYPNLIPNLSTTKSPIAMQSTIIKTYFAQNNNLKPTDIVNIVVAPCTAKKSEINRSELSITSKDTDYILTTRELAMLIKEENIDIMKLKDSKYDSPMPRGSGAGVIFGTSGGVCEATLRTTYYFMTGKNLPKSKIIFKSVRGMEGIKEASINIDGREIKVAVCNGMKNAKELIDKLLKKEVYYDFIEVMNCIGGCIAGGGMPKVKPHDMLDTKIARMNALYSEDENLDLRLCHENPNIISIYENYLENPNSKIAQELLHTKYEDKSYMLKDNKKD